MNCGVCSALGGLGCEANAEIAVEWLNKAEVKGDAKIAKLT